MTKDEIQKIAATYFESQPVKRAYLFGSYARDEADELSDIDILVEFDREHARVDWYKHFFMMEELSVLLHHKVDLVSTVGMSPHIGPIIDAQKVSIYEKSR